MAKICVNCGKTIDPLEDVFYIDNDKCMCAKCTSIIKNDINRTNSIESHDTFANKSVLFDNIGGKIKALASIIAWIGIICSIIIGFILCFYMTSNSFILGIVVAAVGSLCSWVGSFLLYGFGQLIENTDIIVKKLK